MLKSNQACASLYIPSTHKDLADIAVGNKLAQVSSLIFCTEDAVTAQDLPAALQQLSQVLPLMQAKTSQQRFIRVRNPQVMQQLLQCDGIDHIDGFVLPKITAANIADYTILAERGFALMPTLETAEVFVERDMLQLRDILLQPMWRQAVVSLRIGGNDLLGLLGMRRSAGHTLYDTVLGTHIDRLVGLFKPAGFDLSAPVFEFLSDTATLQREIKADLLHGLTGKTAIHPTQVPLIESMYQISEQDINLAQIIVTSNTGVFKSHHGMQEPATHRAWAEKVLKHAKEGNLI